MRVCACIMYIMTYEIFKNLKMEWLFTRIVFQLLGYVQLHHVVSVKK